MKVGDRVQFREEPLLGTILKYFPEWDELYPYYVRWDDGLTAWAKASDLEVVEDEHTGNVAD